MLFSQGIMFFIIITTAATLHADGIVKIQTASQVAEALKPVAGNFAYLLFAAGIIGTGLLAIPVLAGSSAYAVAETTGLREGLSRRFGRARGFYGVIAVSTLVGMLISWSGIDPIRVLYYAAALNGLTTPPLIVLVILTANNKSIMGKHVSTKLANVLGWVIVLVMTLAGIMLILDLLKGFL
jgi:Mn2+/Fe2+ NRAMP family transporter